MRPIRKKGMTSFIIFKVGQILYPHILRGWLWLLLFRGNRQKIFSPTKGIEAQREGLYDFLQVTLDAVRRDSGSDSILLESKPRSKKGTRTMPEMLDLESTGLMNADQRRLLRGIPFVGKEQRAHPSPPNRFLR